MMRLRVAASSGLYLAMLAKGCGGAVDKTPPTVQLLTPEPGTVAHQNIAITGKTTGGVARVELVVDQDAAVVAQDLGDGGFAYVLDVSTLDDASHSLRVTAVANSGPSDDATLPAPVSFISLAHNPPNDSWFYGVVENENNNPLAGATVSTYEDPTNVTTADLSGRYSLDALSPTQSYILHVSDAGYLDSFMPKFDASSPSESSITLFSPATVTFLATQFGVVQQPGNAVVLGYVINRSTGSGYVGASVSIDPPPADGPFYFRPDSIYDPGLTATTIAGSFIAFNVPPGADASFTATAGTSGFLTLPSRTAPDALTLMLGVDGP
jgi:hypothetical protein